MIETYSLAALFRTVGAPLAIETIALDHQKPSEVLVRVAAVGLCHTDLHVMRGEHRLVVERDRDVEHAAGQFHGRLSFAVPES